METITSILNYICFTGLNNHVASFIANNSMWAAPLLFIIWKFLQYKASLTETTADDEALDLIGEKIGFITKNQSEEEPDEEEEYDDEDEETDQGIGFIK